MANSFPEFCFISKVLKEIEEEESSDYELKREDEEMWEEPGQCSCGCSECKLGGGMALE